MRPMPPLARFIAGVLAPPPPTPMDLVRTMITVASQASPGAARLLIDAQGAIAAANIAAAYHPHREATP